MNEPFNYPNLDYMFQFASHIKLKLEHKNT